jgi:class 3 adenylate cyclase
VTVARDWTQGLPSKVQGRLPIVPLSLAAQTQQHEVPGLAHVNMIRIIAWRRPHTPWIGGLPAARRRRWMLSHPTPTFVFVDLAGYTTLTEAHGDQVAARVASEFQRAMTGLSREHGAWHVKSMGDGAMIWAPDAARAVALAADTLDEVGSRGDLLPVRIGIHTGPAVMCGWDWYGSTVNVAARLADEAGANEALISAASRAAVRGDLPHPLRSSRPLYLRGLNRPIVAWCLK